MKYMKQLFVAFIMLISQTSWAEKIVIEGTPKTPTISFDISNGVLEIKGRSIPENSIELYKKLNDLVDKYLLQPNHYTIIDFRFKEVDDESIEQLKQIINKFENQSTGISLITVINWHYEEGNNVMLRTINRFEESTKLPFKAFSEDFFYWNVMLNLKESKLH